MPNLADLISRLRLNLHDGDEERWSNEALTRHLQRALAEISQAIPVEASTTLQVAVGTRAVDVSGLDALRIVSVEHPIGLVPVRLVPFDRWGGTLVLDLPAPLTAAADRDVLVRYHAAHTLENLDGATSTTLTDPELEILAAGAAGYAAIEWASFAINRINLGGPSVAADYRTWGNARLGEFRRALSARARRVVSSTLRPVE